jgi:peptide/nickel transport system ATP-binding protein
MAGTGTAHLRPAEQSLLRADELTVEFGGSRGRTVHAVSGISIDVLPGETLSLVGESGCGKSTTGRAIVQFPRPTAGIVRFEDMTLTDMSRGQLRHVRPRFQMIYQDPISSLNPRRTIRRIVEEPIRIWRPKVSAAERASMVDAVLESVGIDPAFGSRYASEFSGGQCQRVCIARALVLGPRMVICDEPVSALDVSVQAQILNLLEEMKLRYGLTLIFISHDLAVVRNVSDRIGVMYLGKLCEVGSPESVYEAPAHPYTRALMTSVPVPDPDFVVASSDLIQGELPSPMDPPSGCRFRTRCPAAADICAAEEPVMRAAPDRTDHYVACHFPAGVPVGVR